MNMKVMSKNVRQMKIGKEPVVVLPVSFWKSLCDNLEELEEYYEMSTSVNYKKAIAKARKSKSFVSSEEAYKKLGLA